MAHEPHLRVFVIQFLEFLTQFPCRDGVIVEVLKPQVEQFEQPGAVESGTFRQFIHLIVLQTADDRGGHVEVVLVLHVTIAEQAATHQRVDIGGKAKRTDFVDVEIRGQVVVVHTAWSSFHADAEKHCLAFADAIVLAQKIYFFLRFPHECGTHL